MKQRRRAAPRDPGGERQRARIKQSGRGWTGPSRADKAAPRPAAPRPTPPVSDPASADASGLPVHFNPALFGCRRSGVALGRDAFSHGDGVPGSPPRPVTMVFEGGRPPGRATQRRRGAGAGGRLSALQPGGRMCGRHGHANRAVARDGVTAAYRDSAVAVGDRPAGSAACRPRVGQATASRPERERCRRPARRSSSRPTPERRTPSGRKNEDIARRSQTPRTTLTASREPARGKSSGTTY